ncbi:hypothetical protein Zmor_003360 [Zophobas morio]|uniref:Myosuppressin n=2 Tax=Zophobas TaxID=7073 RepID=A0AA38M185_9CUCU|nr:hypothetical protein Zmor_003360 [Zophobas morio]UXO98085.1 myosuppressin [Zophobas atratus]
MHQYTFAAVVFGVAAVFLSNASTTAYMISCPPNDLLEASPSLRHLCYIVEKAVVDNSISDEPSYRRVVERDVSPLAERVVNPNAKRQDVDHVFLRFGRRFGL